MKKQFHIEYLESSPADGLVIHRSAVMVVRNHFRKGRATNEHQGFRRKCDRDAHILTLNAAAGRTIAQPI